MTKRMASWSARHPWRTIGIWVAAVVLSVVAAGVFLGDALTGEAEQLNNPESVQAYDLMGERIPPRRTATPEFTSDVVLIRSAAFASTDPRFRTKVSQ